MKQILLITLLLAFKLTAFSQAKVQWNFSYDEKDKVVNCEAIIAEGWHLYSQHVENDIGPVPTSFTFEENKSIKLIGRVDEPTPVQKYDENFEAMLDFFLNKVVFKQRISMKEPTILKGFVTYMVCNETMCLPPTDEHFQITIK